jgi:hypothetical protein
MEEQGIVLHGFLLWAGRLGVDGLRLQGLDEDGEEEEQRKRERDSRVGDLGTAKERSHASKVANAGGGYL